MKEFISKLHHVGIPTADMDGTVQFYSEFGAKIIFEKQDTFEGEPIRVVLMEFCGTVLEFFERKKTAGQPGAIDHLAFETTNIDELYAIAKKKGFKLMDECAEEIQTSSYWPRQARWFMVIGVNGEKIEFCSEGA